MHGPAGWYRHLAGTMAAADIRVNVTADGKSPHAQFRIENTGHSGAALTLKDAYGAGSQTLSLNPGQSKTVVIPTQGGWYDLTVTSAADPSLSASWQAGWRIGRALRRPPAGADQPQPRHQHGAPQRQGKQQQRRP